MDARQKCPRQGWRGTQRHMDVLERFWLASTAPPEAADIHAAAEPGFLVLYPIDELGGDVDVILGAFEVF